MTLPSETPAPQRKFLRTAAQTLLHYGGSALALLLLFRFLGGPQVWQPLASLPARLWLLVLAGYLAVHCIGVGKWRLMVNTAGAGLNFLQAARCYFAGLFGSLLLPSLIGGDLVRAALAMRLGRSKAAVLLGSFLDRIIDLSALALLGAAGAFLIPGALDVRGRKMFVILGAVAAVGAALIAAALAFVPAGKFSFRIRGDSPDQLQRIAIDDLNFGSADRSGAGIHDRSADRSGGAALPACAAARQAS